MEFSGCTRCLVYHIGYVPHPSKLIQARSIYASNFAPLPVRFSILDKSYLLSRLVVLIFMVDPMKALMFIVLFLVLQQIEGNLIYPHVVGNSVGLPSIWVLAAVSIGGSLMGVVGMLIFIPIVSVAYALFREIVYLKLKKQGVDPAELEV